MLELLKGNDKIISKLTRYIILCKLRCIRIKCSFSITFLHNNRYTHNLNVWRHVSDVYRYISLHKIRAHTRSNYVNRTEQKNFEN